MLCTVTPISKDGNIVMVELKEFDDQNPYMQRTVQKLIVDLSTAEGRDKLEEMKEMEK